MIGLLVALVVSLHLSISLRKARSQARSELRESHENIEDRLSKVEYALQDLDPTAIERRDEELVRVLRSLLEYTESLGPLRTPPSRSSSEESQGSSAQGASP